jgi:hypothetical protein
MTENNNNIKLINEDGTIVGRNPETGEKIPIELGETIMESMSTGERTTAIKPIADVTHPDYGAEGDGTTDDTAAIKSAIASNRVVFFPPGEYLISDALLADSLENVTFQGVGRQSEVVQSDGQAMGIRIQDSNYVTIQDLYIRSTSTLGPGDTSSTGIYAAGTSHNIDILNCYIADFPYDGISVVSDHQYIRFIGNYVEGSGDNNYNPGGTTPGNVRDFILANNIGINCGHTDFHCSNSLQRAALIANVSTGGETGIDYQGDGGLLIKGNSIYNPSEHSIHIMTSDGKVTITSNYVEAGSLPALEALSSDEVIISNNNFQPSNNDRTVQIVLDGDGTIANNIINDPSSANAALNISNGKESVSVVGNKIIGGDLRFKDTERSSIIGNVVGGDILIASGTDYNTFVGNNISGTIGTIGINSVKSANIEGWP